MQLLVSIEMLLQLGFQLGKDLLLDGSLVFENLEVALIGLDNQQFNSLFFALIADGEVVLSPGVLVLPFLPATLLTEVLAAEVAKLVDFLLFETRGTGLGRALLEGKEGRVEDAFVEGESVQDELLDFVLVEGNGGKVGFGEEGGKGESLFVQFPGVGSHAQMKLHYMIKLRKIKRIQQLFHTNSSDSFS